MRREKEFLRAAACLLALALAWGEVPGGCLRASAATGKETEETQEEEDPAPEVIEIRTAEDFEKFAQQCYLDSWSVGKWVVLKEDIVLPHDRTWSVPTFSGTFDGQQHTIRGYVGGKDGYVEGLFRYIGREGEVKNLNLRGNIQGAEEDECIGSLCGVNYGTIRNCSFEGTVSGTDTVGGIAGTNQGTGVITGCRVNGHVAGYYMTGGIAGVNHGTISYSRNDSAINDDSEWVETDDEMGTGLFLSINVSDSDVELYSGVDTGGIAGYSDGVIANCDNYGRVGYEHTGYNIGGIAGRHSGLVMLCSNYGEIYGRKDVGGIVGQMEPYIEVDEAQSLRNSVNKLHDLIGQMLDHMQEGKDVIKEDMDSLTAYGDGARNCGHALADQLADFVDSNVAQAKEITARMDYVTDQLPSVLDSLSHAQEAFGRFNDCMKRTVENADFDSVSGNDLTSGADELVSRLPNQAIRTMAETAQQTGATATTLSAVVAGPNGSVQPWNLLSGEKQGQTVKGVMTLASQSGQWASEASQISGELRRIADVEVSEGTRQNLEAAADELQNMADCLKAAGDNARAIVNYLNAQPQVRFTALGDNFRTTRENLNVQLTGISDSLKRLSGHASDYSDVVNDDLNDVNDQLNVVFNLLADHFSENSGLSVEEMYETVSEQEMDSIVTGRTDACTNSGSVRGDINIGGIAGAMSIDEEDPEDNAAGNLDYEIGRRFIMKCLITHSVNQGDVLAKKDGAGGIVGYMEHGIVSWSEGYGSVESTEGNYVGGICGQSLTVIRRCYALCNVSGGTCVGGIAGYAYTLTDCLALVNIEGGAGRKGNIAGRIAEGEETGTDGDDEERVARNYYVGEEPYGIDGISYENAASPLSYEELLTVEGIPARFRHLQVFFRVEDALLGSQEVAYGDSLSHLSYPQIPDKEGYYGVWPDYSDQVMKGDLVIHGEYRENVLVVESDEKDGETGEDAFERPYALIEQTFTEDTALSVDIVQTDPPQEIGEREYVLYHTVIENGGVDEGDVFSVRLLNPYEKAEVWGLVGGTWTRLDSKERGHYLQTDMTGAEETFCIVREKSNTAAIAAAAAGALCAVIAAALAVRSLKRRRRKQKA